MTSTRESLRILRCFPNQEGYPLVSVLLERFSKDYKNHTYTYSFRKVDMKICMEVTRKIQTVELVQPLWKTMERFLKEKMLYDLDIMLDGIYIRGK